MILSVIGGIIRTGSDTKEGRQSGRHTIGIAVAVVGSTIARNDAIATDATAGARHGCDDGISKREGERGAVGFEFLVEGRSFRRGRWCCCRRGCRKGVGIEIAIMVMLKVIVAIY